MFSYYYVFLILVAAMQSNSPEHQGEAPEDRVNVQQPAVDNLY